MTDVQGYRGVADKLVIAGVELKCYIQMNSLV